MASPADIDKDPFLELLTDALRAGPGSPEWREAVSKLKSGGEQADEYRLLIEAREALESGKDYRSVRAGPGFTRKLLSSIENERAGEAVKRPFPTAIVVAVLAALIIIGVIATVVYQLYPHETASLDTKAINELANTYLPTDVLSTTFEGDLPMNWRKIGSLPVDSTNGLTVGPGTDAGGGIVTSDSLPSDQPLSMTVTLKIAAPGDDLVPQIFVSNSPDFSSDRATAEQELVFQLKGDEQTVVASGRVEHQAVLPPHTQTVTVRIVINHDLAIVESNGSRLWAGANRLGDKPRYFGIRFIRTSAKPDAGITAQSVRIQKR
jgi:hypothetical protein